MPSTIAHSTTGLAVSAFRGEFHGKRWPGRTWIAQLLLTLFIANAPDMDFIPQLITGTRFHHGFSHSIVFTVTFSAVFALLFSAIKGVDWGTSFISTTLIYGSHLLLDYLSSGGTGIAVLWPFTNQSFHAPVTIFPPVHYTRGLLDPSHLTFIAFELGYSLLLMLGIYLWKVRRDDAQGALSERKVQRAGD